MKHEIHFPNRYFEAIIQLRPFDEEVFRFIEKQIMAKGKVTIAKIVEQKTGIDIYISSRKFAKALGKKFKQTFKGEVKMSPKLFSRDKLTSKDLYRLTVLLRLKPKDL
ncbi:hypothetical protein HY643_03250 [Candidatus Woesearchaeota archaeon]|nr:hypothetical protein [Candidatus Woesearchaeota archaeon]